MSVKDEERKLTKKDKQNLLLYSIQLGVIVATITCVLSIIGTCYFFVLRLRSPQKQLEEQAILSDEDVHKFLEDNGIELDEKGENIVQYIQNYSMYDVGAEDLKDGIYRGIVNSLKDIYSEYITYDDNKLNKETNSGKFVGIGIRYSKRIYDNTMRILSVVPGGPADKAGIQANDFISKIDDVDITKFTDSELSNAIRGDAGTSVKITVMRGEESIDCNVVRGEVTSKLVDWKEITDGVGAKNRIVYIHLREFNGKAAEQMKEACDYASKENISNIILDLRDNGGGNVEVLEDIASFFIKKGKIAEIRGRNNLMCRDVYSNGSNYNFKTICLINKNTASASEMLSGSLRDINDTILIGEKTFGKGIAQSTIDLSDGSALKLTTAEYYLYNGESIHKVGIEPDIEIKHHYVDDVTKIESDEVILKAVEVFNNNLYTAEALKNYQIELDD